METPLNKIKQLLKNKTGLDSGTIGSNTVEKILKQRMLQCKISHFDDYYQLITHNSEELNELLEVSIIPETWFFRDIRPFEIIYKNIQKQLIYNKSSCFNILSIPCSTGEEAYSIAIYLTEKGIPESAFNIDAADISPRVLQYAEQGIYSSNSFRGKNYQQYRKKYFAETGRLYQIKQKMQKKISFFQLNILQAPPSLEFKYNFILCRNLLIYFDLPTKSIAFRQLSKLLKDNGMLFIGPSEFGCVPDDILQNCGNEQAFALIKHQHPDCIKKPAKTVAKSIRKHPVFNNQKYSKSTTEKIDLQVAISKKTADADINNKNKNITKDEDNVLIQAQQLADSAEFDKAESLCLQYIDNHSEDADALFLLGLIASSREKNIIAESMFRKSLFLNPQHYESLVHLSLLLQKSGDQLHADLFKQRADRALQRKNKD